MIYQIPFGYDQQFAMENPLIINGIKWRFRSLGKSSISMGHFPTMANCNK